MRTYGQTFMSSGWRLVMLVGFFIFLTIYVTINIRAKFNSKLFMGNVVRMGVEWEREWRGNESRRENGEEMRVGERMERK